MGRLRPALYSRIERSPATWLVSEISTPLATTKNGFPDTLLAACPDTGFGLDMITEMMYQVFG